MKNDNDVFFQHFKNMRLGQRRVDPFFIFNEQKNPNKDEDNSKVINIRSSLDKQLYKYYKKIETILHIV
jgi:hypothetical protein